MNCDLRNKVQKIELHFAIMHLLCWPSRKQMGDIAVEINCENKIFKNNN